MVNAYFFDSIGGDRSYSASDFADAFGVFLQTGVIPDENGYYGLTVTGTNFNVLNPGKAVIQGHFIDVPVSESITDIPTGSYNGMIVLRLDVTGERQCTVNVRADRVAQQDDSIWELPLYNVVVANGTITSIEDVRKGGGAMSQMTSRLKGVTNDPIIMKGYGQKSWSIQRQDDAKLYFVPSSTVGEEDWDFSKSFYLADSGSFGTMSSGFVNTNFEVRGICAFKNNVTMSTTTPGLEFKMNGSADDHQIGLRVTGAGNYIDSVTSNYGAFKRLFFRANVMETNTYFVTTAQEVGFCGVGARVMDDVTLNVAGTGVNFRQRRLTAPSSITLAPLAKNTDVAAVAGSMITQDGFWLSINGLNSGAPTYLYWRGTYTTNG